MPPIQVTPVPPSVAAPPTYVEHGGELSNRHPAAGTGARMYGFLVPADAARIDDWCALCLNEPSKGAEYWSGAADFVLLAFTDIPRLASTDPLDAELGYTHEREVALWAPLFDNFRWRTSWTVPYIWVDSHYAFAGGRETYGFPKQMGIPTIPVGIDAPAVLNLDTVTLATFGPNSEAVDQPVITVSRPANASAVPLSSTWGNPTAALTDVLSSGSSPMSNQSFFADPLSALSTMSSSVGTMAMFFADLVLGRMPVVLLKQFRAAGQPGQACYQGIVSVEVKIDQVGDMGWLPNDYTAVFSHLDGQPMHRELGVPVTPVPVPFAFWLDFDFTVELGEVLWEA